MTLAPGHIVGSFEVEVAIGRGGMGEVYRARDTRLRRHVALKVLPESFAADADRLARFQREALLLAALNHPHIAAIYGVEGDGPTTALVLEYVDGPTLADRIAGGPIPPDDALDMVRQIAGALEAAHDQGIIHRDLKPSNIKVRDDGTVKLLDFGLARALASSDERGDLSQSPTMTSPAMTRTGILIGTAAYISPEVAKGRPADRRSDVWALGCVLYEMLTGTQAFGGKDIADVLGAVMRLEPDWQQLPETVPPGVTTVLKRCLQKDPAERMRDVADARFLIEEAFTAPVVRFPPPAAASRAWTIYGGIAVLTMVAALAMVASSGRTALPELRLDIVTPAASDPLAFALAPDGRSLVYQARVDGRDELWLRRFDSEEPRRLGGTEGGRVPFWSPDSRSVAFFADAMLKRIDLADGFVRTLAAAPQPRGGTWNGDGTIVFGGVAMGALSRVPAGGGAVRAATELLPGQTNHRWPTFLPDGREFLLVALGTPDGRGLYIGSTDDLRVRRISDRESGYAFMPPDLVMFVRRGAVLAQRLNRGRSNVEGEFLPLARKGLIHWGITGHAALSPSASGAIAYRASAPQTQVVWLARDGSPIGMLTRPDETQPVLNALSADGRLAAAQRMTDGNADVWLVDTERGTWRRLTTDPAFDGSAIFSPDGSRVIYMSDGRADVFNTMFSRRSDGTGEPEEVFEFDAIQNHYPVDWSRDGTLILYLAEHPETVSDLWVLPLTGDRRPFPVVRGPFAVGPGRFSPDGRWVAFASSESGQSEIYVQSFPEPGEKVSISQGAGGVLPRWRDDVRELYYVAPDNRLMAVPLVPRDSTLQPGVPQVLFTLPAGMQYDPALDGQRFLTTITVSEAPPITVLFNWRPRAP